MSSFFKTVFQVVISITGLLSAVICIYKLQMFISFRLGVPISKTNNRPTSINLDEKVVHDEIVEAILSGIVDVLLLCVFTLQHSAMAHPGVRQFISDWGFGAAERSLYVIATSVTLLLLFSNWLPIPWYIWQFNSAWVHSACFIVHCIVWIIIYGGCIQMDIIELVGIKQVYYYMNGSTDPMNMKSASARQLYSHMRHPSFFGFCALFWLYPYMSVDRLLLTVILTMYMLLAWNVDHLDYQYQKEQLSKKEEAFSRPIGSKF